MGILDILDRIQKSRFSFFKPYLLISLHDKQA